MQPRDEFSDIPVKCPVCGRMADSVYKTGNKVFYNHGDARAIFKNNKLQVTWDSCEQDRIG